MIHAYRGEIRSFGCQNSFRGRTRLLALTTGSTVHERQGEANYEEL